METRAAHVVVGLFVLVLATAIVLFLVWLSDRGTGSVSQRYLIYFTGEVTGLGAGNPVRFRGIPVGEVVSVRIDPEDFSRIETVIEIATTTPVKEDSFAQLDRPGLTGPLFVQLGGGTPQAGPPKQRDGEPYPRIESKPTELAQVMQSAPGIAEAARALLNQINAMMTPENKKSVSNILANIDTLTSHLSDRRGEMDRLVRSAVLLAEDTRQAVQTFNRASGKVDELLNTATLLVNDVRTTIKGLNQATGQLDDNLGVMRQEMIQTLVSLRQASDALAGISRNLDRVVRETREPVADFASSGLYEMMQLMVDMRELTTTLNRIAGEFERDPARYLFGDTNQGYELR